MLDLKFFDHELTCFVDKLSAVITLDDFWKPDHAKILKHGFCFFVWQCFQEDEPCTDIDHD